MPVSFSHHVRLKWDSTSNRFVPLQPATPPPVRYSQRFVDLWALICALALAAVIALFATGVVD